LQSRAATAEKLLAEARQNLSTLTEEMRSFDAKAVEASIARNSAENRPCGTYETVATMSRNPTSALA
jgi:hypothetical protein